MSFIYEKKWDFGYIFNVIFVDNTKNKQVLDIVYKWLLK